VFFDDLIITHTKGKVLQEDHYYPFGMNINALSSTAPLSKPNQFKYNGKELNTEFNLNWYSYGAREYDAQIGRFIQVDPMADERSWLSPFNYVQNNPLLRIDPTGGIDITILGRNNSSVTIKTDLVDIEVNAGAVVGDLGGNYEFEGDDILEAALDIAGTFDPTGLVDGAAAVFHAGKGDWGNALISTAGLLPFVGDLAKVGKVGRHVKTINKAIGAVHGNSKLSKKAQHGYEIFSKKTGEVLEYGISGQKRSAKQAASGGSPRINQKLGKKYNNDPNVGGRVVNDNLGNRKGALEWEQSQVNKFNKQNKRPPQQQKRPKPKNN
jgi:RHS repeat-associated protein